MAKGKIEQEIALKVTGAKDVKEAARIVDELDGETATVKVGVDADQGVKDIKSFTKLIEGLSDEDKTIVLKARADQAEREIKKLTGQIGRAKDAHTVQIKVEAIGNARAELERIHAEAKKLDSQEVDIDVKATGLDDVADKLGDLPGALGAAAGAFRGLGSFAGAGALVAGAAALMTAYAQAAVESRVLAGLTGATVTEASKLQNVWKTTGADINDLADVLLQMNGVLLDSPEIAEQLSINLADGRDITERFAQVVDAVNRSTLEAAEKAQLMSNLFGEEGVRQVGKLNAVLGPGGLTGTLEDAVGLTEEQAAEAEQLNAQLLEMKIQWDRVKTAIAQGVLPVMSDYVDFAEQASSALERAAGFLPEPAQDVFDPTNLLRYTTGVGLLGGQLKRAGDIFDAVFGGDKIEAAFVEVPDAVDDGTAALDRFFDELRKLKAAKEGVRPFIDVINEFAAASQRAANDAAIALGGVQQSLIDMGSSFNDMARRESAISDVFDLGNAPLEARERIVDINEALRDLGEFIEEEGVPDILDPNDVDAQPYLAKIRGLRGPIQEAIAGAFAADGPAAAVATADAYVRQIVESLDGRLTTAEVQELLGLTDIRAIVEVAVDQESLREAELLLETLTGLAGQTPWSAEVALALASGELSPQAANLLIARELEGIGIDVPSTLLPPDDASRAAALIEANAWAARPGHEVDMQASVNDPSIKSLIAARNAGQDDADRMPIHYPSVVDPPRRSPFRPFAGIFGFDGGGTVGPGGGIAGERGPEILNDRYLAVGPTYVPPGTKVTSRRRTAVIWRHGLKRYDSGGIVGGVPNVTVNFNGVGNIGNRSDMDRNVRRSLQRIERIYGTR